MMTREEVNIKHQQQHQHHNHLGVSLKVDTNNMNTNNGRSLKQASNNNQITTLHNTNGSTINSDHTLKSHQPYHNHNSTIAILRRHPMYDSLVLVKRFSPHLNGYTLEFPLSDEQQQQQQQHHHHNNNCNKTTLNKTKLISKYLDGDDPMYKAEQERYNSSIDEGCELVYVPMNGLLDRLDIYEGQNVSIDSQVYAFAMGLRTAEKFLTTSSMKELQETPSL